MLFDITCTVILHHGLCDLAAVERSDGCLFVCLFFFGGSDGKKISATRLVLLPVPEMVEGLLCHFKIVNY